ncbi:uncharacterized membrane protein YhaH (DUF805 family) [Sphingomonas jejuensis]|uniref:Uncharacterized membrane protein YhaH (DUF805 family) n=1 Tax=Sphingomonas jejuensis TaxID=904715 RepID=A0ABX0XJG4_9SPHN|nr:DUF805 domain-containing protein [Sphingomonas jejuensis]NJC33476.1 uncharacterized membrane protein YhaH (DUF805 family) [Sphingomonas jejuensis]
MKWMILPLRRYADFKGRSGRREFWFFQLFIVVVLLAAQVAMFTNDPGMSRSEASERFPVWAGYGLLPFLVPLFAVTVRRLHDLGWSGWWLIPLILAGAIPAIDTIAGLAWLIIMALPGSRRDNRFGESLRTPVQGTPA